MARRRPTPPRRATTPTPAKPEKKEVRLDSNEDLFQPALKGEARRIRPAFDKKLTKPPKSPGEKTDPPRRLAGPPADNLRNLDAAQKGLKSDEQTLEEMIQSLMNASQKGPPNDHRKNPNGKSPADQLMDMLRSRGDAGDPTDGPAGQAIGKNGQPTQGRRNRPRTRPQNPLLGNSVARPAPSTT